MSFTFEALCCCSVAFWLNTSLYPAMLKSNKLVPVDAAPLIALPVRDEIMSLTLDRAVSIVF
jgi:hypothetical protein